MIYAYGTDEWHKDNKRKLALVSPKLATKEAKAVLTETPPGRWATRHKEWERRQRGIAKAMERVKKLPDMPPLAKTILMAVAAKFKCDPKAMIALTRVKDIQEAKYEYTYRLRIEGRYSWTQIGTYCGGIDHTSALCRCVEYAKRHGLPSPVNHKKISP